MYNTIKRLYEKTGNKVIVENAVKKGWLTEIEAKSILGETKREDLPEAEQA